MSVDPDRDDLDAEGDAEARPRRRRRAPGETDPGCSYRAGITRCPLPAVWYEGRAAKGWCRLHADPEARLPDGPQGQIELRRIIDNRREVLEQHYPRERHLDAAVDRLVAEHPEWQRRDGESRDDYENRMREIGRQRAQRLAARLSDPRAPSATVGPAPTPRPPLALPPDVGSVAEDWADAIEERAAKHQADGAPASLATRLALEDVIRERLEAGAL